LGQFSKIARLAQLAPDLVAGCLAENGSGLALEHVMRGKLTIDWTEQRRSLSQARFALANGVGSSLSMKVEIEDRRSHVELPKSDRSTTLSTL
jgi:hypothetical protein